MANSNTAGFGLTPSRVLGSTPSTQGLGQYWIDAAWGTTIYNGEAVYSAAGYMNGAQGSTTAVVFGTLNGIFYNAATTLKPTWNNSYQATITPANSEDTTAFILDNPWQLYQVACDTALTQAGHMETYNMNAVAGSTTTGKSSNTLDIDGQTHATNYSWRVIRIAEDPSNSDITANFLSVIAVSNLNEFVRKT